MYLELPWCEYALNCHLVYLAISWTRPLCMKSNIGLFYSYTTAKIEIQICSNKHKTGLVETHITCDFPRGGGDWTPLPPNSLDLRMCFPHLLVLKQAYIPFLEILYLALIQYDLKRQRIYQEQERIHFTL